MYLSALVTPESCIPLNAIQTLMIPEFLLSVMKCIVIVIM